MIIGLLGKAGSGKDTVADWLVTNRNFAKVALADPLKRICKDVFDFTDQQLWGPSEFRNAEDKRYLRKVERYLVPGFTDEYEDQDVFLTPRYALQQLGTEWGRNCYPNVWIDYAMRMAEKVLRPWDESSGAHLYDQEEGYYNWSLGEARHVKKTPATGVVIPDCRFRNEFDAIKAAGGKMVKIVRPGAGLSGAAGAHVSESEQEAIQDTEFDLVLSNVGSLEELYASLPLSFEALR